MWVLLILHTCAQQSFRLLGDVWSLTRRNEYVCSYTNMYPVITKLIAVSGQGQETLPSTLTVRMGIIKCVLS